jgi:hypothetical protein
MYFFTSEDKYRLISLLYFHNFSVIASMVSTVENAECLKNMYKFIVSYFLVQWVLVDYFMS